MFIPRARHQRVAIMALLFLAVAYAAKKKNPDDITQTLALPKDPPMVAMGETRRLIFHVSPLSAKGLLSQQTREALKAILKANGGAPVVHIRAFVAGSGDLRRVPQIVSEVFTEKKLPLPSVSVVLAGGLPLENAQVVLEAVSQAKKGSESGWADVRRSADCGVARKVSGSTGVAAWRGDCAESQLFRQRNRHFRSDRRALSLGGRGLVQTQRAPLRSEASCEAVGRGGNIRAAKLAFTGTQVAFGVDEKAAKVAFQRIDRDLGSAAVESADIIATNIYPLSVRIGELAGKVRSTSGTVTVIPFEGIASVDGSFAIDAVAVSK